MKGLITINELPYTIEDLRTLCNIGNIKWSRHALKRFRERNIKSKDFIHCINTGEIIEKYIDDFIPSCLVLGDTLANVKLHAVAGCDKNYVYAVTAYFPTTTEWDDTFKFRR